MKVNVLRVACAGMVVACRCSLAAPPNPGPQRNATGTSAEFVVTTWQMPQGLPFDRVRSVLQTRDGYLWLATYNGAARFDGVRFSVFNDANTPALRNSLISCVFEDDKLGLRLVQQRPGLLCFAEIEMMPPSFESK